MARLNITVKISALVDLIARMEYVVSLNDIIYECRSNIVAYIIRGTDVI